MRIFILTVFFLWCYLIQTSHLWKNKTELKRLRDLVDPPPDVILEKLKKKFNGSEIPNTYVLESDEVPSIEKGYKTKMTDLAGRMREEEIVPDILTEPPETICRIRFSSNYSYRGVENHTVLVGNYLEELECLYEPVVTWRTEKDTFYTLMYVAPDIPHRGNPFAGPFLQWLVVNIPGTNVQKGETLGYYIPPGGERKGWHRHVYLVYKQPKFIKFNETKDYNNLYNCSREIFFPQQFADRYNMGRPWAGNYFMSAD